MMAGLLDFLNSDDARLGIGLLAAGGPQTDPAKTGLGAALSSAMSSTDEWKKAQMQRQLWESQIAENASQNAKREAELRQQALLTKMGLRMMGMGADGGLLGADNTPPTSAQSGADAVAESPAPSASPGITSLMPDAGGVSPYGPMPPAPAAPAAPAEPVSPGGAPAVRMGPRMPSPQELMGYSLLGGKNVGDMLNITKYQQEGIKREGGAYYQDPANGRLTYIPKVGENMDYGPDGKLRAAPGAEQAIARLTHAKAFSEAMAKVPAEIMTDKAKQDLAATFDFVQVTRPDGGTDYMPKSAMKAASAAGAGGTPFGATRSPEQGKFNENWLNETYNPTIAEGKAATNAMANITALRNIDLTGKSGWGTEGRANAANFLVGIGIPAKSAEMYASDAQRFQSVAQSSVLQKFLDQKGVQTKDDATRIQKTFVDLANTPSANQFMLDFAEAQARMQQRKAGFYESGRALAQQKGDYSEVDKRWREKMAGSIWDDPIMAKWLKREK